MQGCKKVKIENYGIKHRFHTFSDYPELIKKQLLR